MRIVLQRVKSASVRVEAEIRASIAAGALVFLGISHDDTRREAEWLSEKILRLRLFADAEGKFNRSLLDTGGSILVVSQFTLYGDARKGTRPSFSRAAPPAIAEPLYEYMIDYLRSASKLEVASGVFGAMMEVELINDGPVTINLEKSFSPPKQ